MKQKQGNLFKLVGLYFSSKNRDTASLTERKGCRMSISTRPLTTTPPFILHVHHRWSQLALQINFFIAWIPVLVLNWIWGWKRTTKKHMTQMQINVGYIYICMYIVEKERIQGGAVGWL